MDGSKNSLSSVRLLQMKRRVPLILLVAIFTGFSCSTSYKASQLQFKDIRVSGSLPMDAEVLAVIRPYSDSVNKSMNDVIGYAEKDLSKARPESELGNFMADALYTMAGKKFNTHIDVAFMNYGGIRLLQIPKGYVTKGKIFELMPFDNLLILQRMKGSVLQQLLDHTAKMGGWPLAGLTMEIKDKRAVNVMIGGKPLDVNATYVTANSDFVANGGDEAEMLRKIPQENIGYVMRDAFFDYIKLLKSEGKNISANLDKRIVDVK